MPIKEFHLSKVLAELELNMEEVSQPVRSNMKPSLFEFLTIQMPFDFTNLKLFERNLFIQVGIF